MNEQMNVMFDKNVDTPVIEILKEIKGLLAFNKKVLNLEDLVLYTGMSESTIYKLSRLNLIPKGDNKEIRKLFFEKDRIDDWLLGKPDVSDEYLEQKFNEQLLKKRR
jgi:predicted DNA-binding transcriptional regulator AlpA